jgi:hypothetical protein
MNLGLTKASVYGKSKAKGASLIQFTANCHINAQFLDEIFAQHKPKPVPSSLLVPNFDFLIYNKQVGYASPPC